ncbi:acetamidase/formamidase family protein [Mycolicibacterium obuense]|uniref:Acetamidase n=1 Tax=Mycolicibacterium obuense TaxID=1807 RepID=A0A0J6WEA2_9MYCO|nr:acetamidase/formamidase family protein [Mycolicibacterium obuense]KKF03717.1 formamidase [Mycolicibacterium obuense]KMO80082.1 Acetamidase [Mycolicibacterium obuense]OKH62502.1 formamidase [Mycobacterium sp. SWH-M1]
MYHVLPATPATVHWGYFDPALPAVLTVNSGDLVAVEALTHHAGDAPDLLMDGEIRAVFDQVCDRGPGPHLLTGPVAVTGARPGDVLQVDILEATPRLPYGSNLAAHWGYLYDLTGAERVTVYELDTAALKGRALFGYDWTTTALADQPGTVVEPTSVTREPALPGVTVALRPHFGTMGVAPATPGRVSSVPPGDHGGNIDNWRIGVGGRMYYPVNVAGALLSIGDPHVSQGDGEISGTALEASLNGLLRLTVRRDLPFTVPVLETSTELLVHGFGDSLDEAMRAAAVRALDLLQQLYGLSRADAYSYMSVAVDFTVTQVVDQRQGVHARIDKRSFTGTWGSAA